MKAKEKLLKRMSDQTGQQITEINLISWDMVEPLINELEVKEQQIIGLIEGARKDVIDESHAIPIEKEQDFLTVVDLKDVKSIFESLLTKIGEIK